MAKRHSLILAAFTMLLTVSVLCVSAVAYIGQQANAPRAREASPAQSANRDTADPSSHGLHWQRVSASAIVHGLIVDPENAPRLYAATTRGFMRSLDFGRHWSQSNLGLTLADPAMWTAAFFAADKALAAGGDSSHLLISQDRGLHLASQCRFAVRGIFALAVDPRDSRTVLAGANGGIWRSDDAGAHWLRVYARDGESISTLAWAGSSSDQVFAGVTPGPRQILTSNDDGRTWRTADREFKGNEGIMALGQTGTGLASILAGTMGHRVWRFNPTTLTWTPSAVGLPRGSHGATLLVVAGRIWLGTMGNGIYTSDDQGRTWVAYGPPMPGLASIVLSLVVRRGTVFAGTAQGIYMLAP